MATMQLTDKSILCGIAVTERPGEGVIGFCEIPTGKARGEKFTLASLRRVMHEMGLEKYPHLASDKWLFLVPDSNLPICRSAEQQMQVPATSLLEITLNTNIEFLEEMSYPSYLYEEVSVRNITKCPNCAALLENSKNCLKKHYRKGCIYKNKSKGVKIISSLVKNETNISIQVSGGAKYLRNHSTKRKKSYKSHGGRMPKRKRHNGHENGISYTKQAMPKTSRSNEKRIAYNAGIKNTTIPQAARNPGSNHQRNESTRYIPGRKISKQKHSNYERRKHPSYIAQRTAMQQEFMKRQLLKNIPEGMRAQVQFADVREKIG